MCGAVPVKRGKRLVGLLVRLDGAARVAALKRSLETPAARGRRLRAALEARPDTVVFVCHGNIMRSAFALAWARAKHPGMAARLLGAGTHAVRGRPAQASALLVAAEMGMPLNEHAATPLSGVEPGENALIICMDRANEANAIAFWPELGPRIFLIGDIAEAGGLTGEAGGGKVLEREVRDPYARGDDATRAAFRAVVELVGAWAGGLGLGE